MTQNLVVLDLCENTISTQACEAIKDLLEIHPIRVLRLANIGLSSKDFTILCLGLAKNSTVEDVDFNSNQIGNC